MSSIALKLRVVVGSTFLLAIVAGCESRTEALSGPSPGATQAQAQANDTPPGSAQEALKRMTATYSAADTYSDAARGRLAFEQNGQPLDQSFDFSVAFERPNKLRLHCYDAMVVSDGKQLSASLAGLEEQVLVVDAPAKLTLDDLMADEQLAGNLTGGMASAPPQLALLLSENALDPILEQSETPTLMAPEEIDGQLCDKVRVPQSGGDLIFWIDRKTHLLRRLELPVGELRKYLENEGRVSNLSLVADFKGARINTKIDERAFQFEAPTGAKLVKRFVVATRPPEPSELLGKQAPDFKFTTLDGKDVTRASLDGKVVVFDFWFTACQPCSQTIPLLNQVYQKYKDSDKVAFFAVNIEDSSVANAELAKTLESWGGQMPFIRDLDQQANKLFKIEGAPTMFILGPDGTVEDHEMGLNPAITTDLPQTIDKLLAGDHTHTIARQRYESRLKAYEDALLSAQQGDTSTVQEIPKAEIATASEPKTFKRTELWKNEELKGAGNILIIPQAGGHKIVVCDGWRAVAELDMQGKLIARHELPIPETGVVTYLRTAVDSSGKRYYVGFADAQQQLYLFDQDFKLLTSFPKPEDGTHDGIADVQIADLDGQGLKLYVGYWGDVGVQGVSLDGQRLWRDRSLQYVLRVALSGPDAQGHRNLLCTNSRGTIVPIDAQGKLGTEIAVPQKPIHRIATADLDNNGQTEICGLTDAAIGSMVALGIGPDGKEHWSYPLPKGLHQNPIEMITDGHLRGTSQGEWIIAGADGSIHIVAGDGQPVDEFNYGSALNGIAATTIDGAPVLLISSSEGLKAWKIEPQTN